jgi:hypothetical protein
MKQVPELPAYLDESYSDVNLWRVWCEYCHAWHMHGAGGKGDDAMTFLGNRVAHCWSASKSPYSETGYDLVYGGRWADLPKEVKRWGLTGKPFRKRRGA